MELQETRIDGYHSETPFSITDSSQGTKILDTCSYHWKDLDLAVIWSDPAVLSQMGNLSGSTFRDSSASLGDLDDAFPLEILGKIVLEMDLASLFRLRQVNSRARAIVDSTKQYQLMISQALQAFCALLRTGLAIRVTLSDFIRLLCEPKCEFCASFGTHVFLPTWNRCCVVCLEWSSELQLMSWTSAKRKLNLSMHSWNQVPSFKALSGVYTLRAQHYQCRPILAPFECCAKAFFRQQYGSRRPPRSIRNPRVPEMDYWRFMSCCAMAWYDLPTEESENGVSCSGCQLASDLETGDTDEEMEFIIVKRAVVYSRQDFLIHFRWCLKAQELWAESNDGTREPISLPNKCKYGGSFPGLLRHPPRRGLQPT
jgi:hypothetical protein